MCARSSQARLVTPYGDRGMVGVVASRQGFISVAQIEAAEKKGRVDAARRAVTDHPLVTAAVEGAAATNGFVEEPTAQPLRGAPPPGSLADRDAKAALASEDGEGKAEANVVLPTDGREGGA